MIGALATFVEVNAEVGVVWIGRSAPENRLEVDANAILGGDGGEGGQCR